MSQLLKHGPAALDDSTIDAWCHFLISQIYRNPWAIDRLRKKVRELDVASLEAEYRAKRNETHPATLREYMAQQDGAFHDESFATLVPSLLKRENMVRAIRSLQWSVLDLADPPHGLITGDTPIMMSNGILVENGFPCYYRSAPTNCLPRPAIGKF